MPSPCTSSFRAISVRVFRWRIWEKKTRSYTWPETHLPRGIMRMTDKATETVVLYSPSLSLKTLDTGILLLAVFTLELEMDCPSETSPCTVAPLPHRHPFSDFFWGEGAAVHRLSETDNPSSNCPSKLTDKVRRIVHSKLKSFHFQIKTYYLSDSNNPSHTNNLSLVWKRSFLL